MEETRRVSDNDCNIFDLATYGKHPLLCVFLGGVAVVEVVFIHLGFLPFSIFPLSAMPRMTTDCCTYIHTINNGFPFS